MGRKSYTLLCAVCLLVTSLAVGADHAKHYTNGMGGLKVGSMPPASPKNFFLRQYHAFYTADKYKDASGNTSPIGRDLSVYAFVNRFIYSSDIKFLGGNLLFDVIIPASYTDLELRQPNGSKIFGGHKGGVGDISITPFTVAWHGQRWDATIGASVYLPTGSFDSTRTLNTGKGFYTFMFTAGGTYYFDDARKWHASLLSRYEIHTKQKETHIRMGQDYQFEWGVGRTLGKYVDVGVAGYWHRQLTRDSGELANRAKQMTNAIGPEIAFSIPKWKLTGSLRSVWEFKNKLNNQGNMTVLTFTKVF